MMWRRCGRTDAPSGLSLENSLAHSSKSNGVIERGVQTIQGTLRRAIEERCMVKVDPDNAFWTWLVEYAGWLVKRAEVGHDGRRPYERLKGKKAPLHRRYTRLVPRRPPHRQRRIIVCLLRPLEKVNPQVVSSWTSNMCKRAS